MVIGALQVELTVVLGQARLPLREVLRLGRGGLVAFDGAGHEDLVEIRANGLPVARGRVIVTGAAIGIEVTDLIHRPATSAEAGLTIGGQIGQGSPSLAGAA